MGQSEDRYSALSLESPSELLHEASKLRQTDAATARTVWSVNNSPSIRQVIAQPASSYRGYPHLQLPGAPDLTVSALSEILLGRRSTRKFTGQPLTLSEVSGLLYYSCAVTKCETDNFGISWGLRCAPSGGALFPIDTYCILLSVAGAAQGLYAHDPQSHSLVLLNIETYRDRLSAVTYLGETIDAAAFCILLVANFPRTKFKYGERGYRFALLEAGHIAQNVLLVAEALGLGSLALGGYVDDELNDIVGTDGCEQAVLYAVLVGRPFRADPTA